MLRKVFGDDSWLVGVAEHELGLVRDVKLCPCCPAPPVRMWIGMSACLVWGVGGSVKGGRPPASGEETITSSLTGH